MGDVVRLPVEPRGLVLSDGNLADLRAGLDAWHTCRLELEPGHSIRVAGEGRELVLGVVEVLCRQRAAPLVRFRLLGEGEVE